MIQIPAGLYFVICILEFIWILVPGIWDLFRIWIVEFGIYDLSALKSFPVGFWNTCRSNSGTAAST